MKKLILTAAAGALLLAPAATFAATYEYMDANGNMQSVNADNESDAMTAASNIAPDSGVMLQTDANGEVFATTNTSDVNGDAYNYVDTSGVVDTITADNAIDAMDNALNIAPHSGVAVDAGTIIAGDVVFGS